VRVQLDVEEIFGVGNAGEEGGGEGGEEEEGGDGGGGEAGGLHCWEWGPRRWWGGRGGCVAFWVELGSWIRDKTSSAGCGEFIPQGGILLFSGRSSGTAINRCTRYGNPQGCPSDTHKIKVSIVQLEDLRGFGRDGRAIAI